VRTPRYKLVLWSEAGERAGELYDLAEDPAELRNRYNDPALRDVQRELAERLAARWMEVDAAVPQGEWAGA
ncbi:MAG: DUF4976 domain-containing protein, partial [Armatimonadota bacterium]|nr:DUF4976 domain-containing protein [Armatimonadota bacterium]